MYAKNKLNCRITKRQLMVTDEIYINLYKVIQRILSFLIYNTFYILYILCATKDVNSSFKNRIYFKKTK